MGAAPAGEQNQTASGLREAVNEKSCGAAVERGGIGRVLTWMDIGGKSCIMEQGVSTGITGIIGTEEGKGLYTPMKTPRAVAESYLCLPRRSSHQMDGVMECSLIRQTLFD